MTRRLHVKLRSILVVLAIVALSCKVYIFIKQQKKYKSESRYHLRMYQYYKEKEYINSNKLQNLKASKKEFENLLSLYGSSSEDNDEKQSVIRIMNAISDQIEYTEKSSLDADAMAKNRYSKYLWYYERLWY